MGKSRQTLAKNGEGRGRWRPGLASALGPDRTKASVAARHFYLIIHIIWEEHHYTLFLSQALCFVKYKAAGIWQIKEPVVTHRCQALVQAPTSIDSQEIQIPHEFGRGI